MTRKGRVPRLGAVPRAPPGVPVPGRGGHRATASAATRHLDPQCLVRSLRGHGERGFALLTQRWTTLQNVTARLSRVGDIAKAALVLGQFEHKMIE
jgi:hypothetical protein